MPILIARMWSPIFPGLYLGLLPTDHCNPARRSQRPFAKYGRIFAQVNPARSGCRAWPVRQRSADTYPVLAMSCRPAPPFRGTSRSCAVEIPVIFEVHPSGRTRLKLSIVIPVLDDADALGLLLRDLGPVPRQGARGAAPADAAQCAGPAIELIVVDGGSSDDSVAVAERAGARVVRHSRGRGQQLDAGIRAATGDWLWLLHADSRISAAVLADIGSLGGRAPAWGRFDVALAQSPLLRLVAAAMNWRSAITGICTGDQGIFIHRELLAAAGGVPRQPLMEDIELSKRLRRLARPLRMRAVIRTSARRWRSHGVVRTILLMWWLRIRYRFGAAPERLARQYHD